LIPSSYGIYHRRCQCGELLPTTFLNGREQLDALCPNCQTEIKTQESVPICIPITGGASVGKTCFLFSALHEFKDKIAPLHGWDVSFLEEQDEEKYSRTLTEFQQGAVPQKTVIGSQSSPTAFNFTISSHQWQTKKTVYFYDAAGESFQDTGILKHHGFYAFFHGMIFIIDPFSIPEIYDMYQNQLATYTNTDLKVSEILLEDTFDNMVVNLEKNFHVKREKHIKQPLAIVINKIDAFDLDKIIGQQAGRELMAKDASIQTLEEAIDQLCRQQFKLWELNNLLVKLEQKFTNYRFFTCSALGHLPMNNTAFQSYGAVEPLLWLLKQTDRKHFK
jgi:GTPase SAR1 family protein